MGFSNHLVKLARDLTRPKKPQKVAIGPQKVYSV